MQGGSTNGLKLFGMQNCAVLSERRVNYTIRRERVCENLPVSKSLRDQTRTVGAMKGAGRGIARGSRSRVDGFAGIVLWDRVSQYGARRDAGRGRTIHVVHRDIYEQQATYQHLNR